MATNLCRCRRISRPTGRCGCQGADRSAWRGDKFVWPAVNGSRHIDRAMRDANESAPRSREELSKTVVADRAAVTGAVHRLRPKLMTVFVVILSLAPIFLESGIGKGQRGLIVAAPFTGK